MSVAPLNRPVNLAIRRGLSVRPFVCAAVLVVASVLGGVAGCADPDAPADETAATSQVTSPPKKALSSNAGGYDFAAMVAQARADDEEAIRRGWVPALLPAADLAAAKLASDANWPTRKAGLWEMLVTPPGGAPSYTQALCVDEVSELRFSAFEQIVTGGEGPPVPTLADANSRMQCGLPPVTRARNGNWQSSGNCNNGGRNPYLKGSQTISGDLSRSYTMKASRTQGQQGNIVNTGQVAGTYKGQCPAGMKPGDMSTNGGPIINVLNRPMGLRDGGGPLAPGVPVPPGMQANINAQIAAMGPLPGGTNPQVAADISMAMLSGRPLNNQQMAAMEREILASLPPGMPAPSRQELNRAMSEVQTMMADPRMQQMLMDPRLQQMMGSGGGLPMISIAPR